MKLSHFLIFIAAILASSCSDSEKVQAVQERIPRERTLTINSKPHFEYYSDGDYYDVHLQYETKEYSVYWPEWAFSHEELDENKTYTIDLLEKEVLDLPASKERPVVWDPRIVRVRDGDNILYDASICSVHNIQMKRELVPIAYGISVPFPEMEEGFPNYGRYPGGCCITPDSPKSTKGWVCPSCKIKKREWESKQQETTVDKSGLEQPVAPTSSP